MTFPSPISHETVLIPASPDQSHELLRLQGKQPDESSAAGQKFDTGADTPNNVIGLDSSSPHDDFRIPLVPPDQKAAHSKLYPPSSDAQNQSHSQSQTQSISLHVPMGLQSNKHLSHVYSPHYPQQQPCATSSSPSPTTTRFSSSPSSTFNNSNYNDSGALESLVPGLYPIEHALFRIPLIRSTPVRPHTAKAESVEAVQLPAPPTTFVNAFVHSPRPGRSPISSADLQAWAETGHFLPSPSLSGSTAVGSDSVVSSAPLLLPLLFPNIKQQISFGHTSKRNTCWEKRVPTEATTIVAPVWGRQAASSHIEQDQTHSHPQPRNQHGATVRSQYSGYGGLAESGSESMSAVEMISRAHHLQNYRRPVTPVPSLSAPCKRQPQTLKSTALPSLSMYLPQSSSFQQPSHRHSPGGSHLIPPSSLAGSPDSVAETRTFDPAFQTSLPIEHRDSSSRDAQNTAVEASQHAIYPSTSSFENNHRIMHSKSNYPH
ncbi:hypothetical protein BS47DRAFT_1393677 [Hydnum rufescens UP504]|uniref:Uncharacterized protein n=1 Tax=Hydnum rufescens UP504 TaxID=1448309 RepID=A0A9P6DSB2_9AGAM|nr:hypothetical protein BS47DRAFT_1393677 [Hydnum rufescens UP504]